MDLRVSSVLGFLLAGIAAPPASVVIFLVLSGVTGITRQGGPSGSEWIVAGVFASFVGTIPSLLFGGLTLLGMRTVFKPWPPRLPVVAAGGFTAAALYCLVFGFGGRAPWGVHAPHEAADSALVAVAILLSGVFAGLIYAPFARRG